MINKRKSIAQSEIQFQEEISHLVYHAKGIITHFLNATIYSTNQISVN